MSSSMCTVGDFLWTWVSGERCRIKEEVLPVLTEKSGS